MRLRNIAVRSPRRGMRSWRPLARMSNVFATTLETPQSLVNVIRRGRLPRVIRDTDHCAQVAHDMLVAVTPRAARYAPAPSVSHSHLHCNLMSLTSTCTFTCCCRGKVTSSYVASRLTTRQEAKSTRVARAPPWKRPSIGRVRRVRAPTG